jgi:hypothetical protein
MYRRPHPLSDYFWEEFTLFPGQPEHNSSYLNLQNNELLLGHALVMKKREKV